MPYQDHIKVCPCCKGWFPFPADNGWVDSVCLECETSLFIDPKYKFLGISEDMKSIALPVPGQPFPSYFTLPKCELADLPEPTIRR